MASEPEAVDDFDALLEAAERLLDATRGWEAAAIAYSGAIKLTRDLSHASNNVLPIEMELDELREAVKIVRSGAPIARRDDRGAIWKAPLTPRGIHLHAALAEPDDPDYLTQLADVLAVERARREEIDADLAVKCGRKHGCQNPKVYWPTLGHAEGPACWVHVTAEERAELEGPLRPRQGRLPVPRM